MKGVDLMSSLFSADLDQLRDEFLARSEGVNEHDFVQLLLRHCPELKQAQLSAKHSLRQRLKDRWREEHEMELDTLNCTRTALPALDATVVGGFHSTTSLLHGTLALEDLSADLDDEGRDAVHQLFHSIDCDGDGNVTWEEVYNFAISTTMQRLEPRPAERIRPYALATESARDDNVYALRYFNHHDVLCVSSRHNPLQLLNVTTFKPLLSAPIHHFAVDEIVTAACHVPESDVVCAFTNNLSLKAWCVVNSRLQLLPNVVSEEYICHLACPNTMPSTLFAGTSVGTLKLYDVTRHAEPRLRCSIPVHTTGEVIPGTLSVPGIGRRPTDITGDIMTTFTFITPSEHRVISTAYDQRICITDLNSVESLNMGDSASINDVYKKSQRAVTCIGTSDSVVTHLEYCESYHLIMAAGMNRQISAWVPHASLSPKTVFEDLAAPHTARLVGLTSLPGSPQLISTDADGIMKIWDIRTFRCTQTIKIFKKDSHAENDATDDAFGRGQGGDEAKVSNRRHACGAVYVSSTKQLVAADSNGFTSYWYDPGANPTQADPQHIISITTNPFADTIITLTATSLGIWDAAEGALNSHHKFADVNKADATICFVDDRVRRILVGFSDGMLRTYGYHGLTPLKKVHLHTKDITAAFYFVDARAIYSCSLDGTLTCWLEKDPGSPVSKIRLNLGGLTCMDHNRELAVIVMGSTSGRLNLVDLTHPRVNIGESEGVTGVAVKCVSMIGNFPLFAAAFINGAIRIYSCRPAFDVVALFGFEVADRCRSPSDRSVWSLEHRLAKTSAVAGRILSPNSRGTTSGSSDPVGAKGEDSIAPTAMRVDLVTHTLWVGDTGGWVTGWQLCPLLQALNAFPTAYPGTPMFQVDAAAAVGVQLPMAVSFSAHRDDVVTLEILPEQGCIATSGDDRRVILWSPSTGTSFGELCFGRRGAESLSADNATQVQAPVSPAKHRKLGGRRHTLVTPHDEEIPPYALQRVHAVAKPLPGPCKHELVADQHTSTQQQQLDRDGLVSRAFGSFEDVSNAALVPLMVEHNDDAVDLPSMAGESGRVSNRNRPGAAIPSSQSVCAVSTPLAPKQPRAPKDARGKSWRLTGSATGSKEPLSPRDEAQTTQHLSTLLGQRTRAAVEERLRWERDASEANFKRVPSEVSESREGDSPSVPLFEPETFMNSPRELSARQARELSQLPVHVIPLVAGCTLASETLLSLHDISSRGPARASIAASLSSGTAKLAAQLPPRPPPSKAHHPSTDDQVVAPSATFSSTSQQRSPLLAQSLFHVAGIASVPASPAPVAVPTPRTVLNLIVTPRTIGKPDLPASPVPDAHRRPQTSDSANSKIPSLAPSRGTSAASARDMRGPSPQQRYGPWSHSTPPSSRQLQLAQRELEEVESPRKRLALGSVALGRKVDTTVKVKPDPRQQRQEALKRELHQCLLGSSHAQSAF